MTQQEFETRVKMTVTAAEFEAINDVYMRCDAGKDEFCKAWASINKNRIALYKKEAQMKEAESRKIEKAANLYFKLVSKGWAAAFKPAYETLTPGETKFITSLDLNVEFYDDLNYVSVQLGKYAGILK